MKLRMFELGLVVAILATGAFMCWDNNLLAAMNLDDRLDERKVNIQNEKQQNDIPENAIRLRILANSDTDEDQRIKRLVRNRIVEQINGWLKQGRSPSSYEEAHRLINVHLEELKQIALDVLAQEEISYRVKIKLEDVSFPTKWYGGKVYPAGTYEALLVTLGDGSGQNWWCVLFPPLCFLNEGTAQAKNYDPEQLPNPSSTGKETMPKRLVSEAPKTEVRFFLWEVAEVLVSCITSVWSALFGE